MFGSLGAACFGICVFNVRGGHGIYLTFGVLGYPIVSNIFSPRVVAPFRTVLRLLGRFMRYGERKWWRTWSKSLHSVELCLPETFCPARKGATTSMNEDSLLPFDLPAVQRKKVPADFQGGLISSDGGLVLLRRPAVVSA